MLQQHLPFTVLKLRPPCFDSGCYSRLQQHLPFTVLKHYELHRVSYGETMSVATAPTVYGIETVMPTCMMEKFIIWLQQHLPFTVLKLIIHAT